MNLFRHLGGRWHRSVWLGLLLMVSVVSFVSTPAAPLPLVLDMVHHNPGEPHYVSQFNDPVFAKNMGYNGKVFFLFESAHLAVDWDRFDRNILPVGSADRAWVDAKRAEINQKYSAAKAAGLDVYCMSDLVLFPKRLVSRYNLTSTMGNVNDPNTELWLRRLLQLMFTQFPQLDGIVVRIGETYLDDAPYHQGKIDNQGSPTRTIIPLMNLLRDEVCVKLGKKVIFRTWNSFDVNLANFLAVSDAVAPHSNLIWSVKHVEGDFHRGNAFSKVLGQGRHPFIVEVQCAREYEGKGAYPNYIANGVIEGFEEHLASMGADQIRSLRELQERSPLLSGVWTWSRGGGWEGPDLKSELWLDLNTWVVAQWALNPAASEASLFARYAVERLGLPTNQVADLRQLALFSAQAVWRGKRSTGNYLNQWWNRDQYFRFPVIPANSAQRQLVLDDQNYAVALWDQMVILGDKLTPVNGLAAETIRSSTRYGQNLYRMFRAVVNLSALTPNGDAAQLRSWLAIYDGCKTNHSSLAAQYSNTLATYYVEPSRRMSASWGEDPPVALPRFRAALRNDHGKTTSGAIETFDQGFPSSAGTNGWVDAWNFIGISTPTTTTNAPLRDGGGYLAFAPTNIGDSALRRTYLGHLTSTNDETVRFSFRVDQLWGFNSLNDYVTITDGTPSIGGASPESSFIVRAYGAAPNLDVPARTWAFYQGGRDRSNHNLANYISSGVPLTANRTYQFKVILHPTLLSYDVTITDGFSSVTTTNLGFRDNNFSVPNTLVFNARKASPTNIIELAVDSIDIAPQPVPRLLLSNANFNPATNLTPLVLGRAHTSLVGENTLMKVADQADTNAAKLYRTTTQ